MWSCPVLNITLLLRGHVQYLTLHSSCVATHPKETKSFFLRLSCASVIGWTTKEVRSTRKMKKSQKSVFIWNVLSCANITTFNAECWATYQNSSASIAWFELQPKEESKSNHNTLFRIVCVSVQCITLSHTGLYSASRLVTLENCTLHNA